MIPNGIWGENTVLIETNTVLIETNTVLIENKYRRIWNKYSLIWDKFSLIWDTVIFAGVPLGIDICSLALICLLSSFIEKGINLTIGLQWPLKLFLHMIGRKLALSYVI